MALHISEAVTQLVCLNLDPTEARVKQIFCGATATATRRKDSQLLYSKRTLYFDEEEDNDAANGSGSLLKDVERPCRFKDNI
eukprot:CAMPEP_0170067452 /NCGR_PEP_ID=MMETSP0019_2-20121128/6793_1 /TAXON_ID=98059 /ORGANISM="Dinobryon sp., Strain UTEXLB2267" /LENGTH=81 /DNA_ID=CAMNT_0010274843 /DNA_START=516 /DNA_END=758 /DNA_ORIENTATION=+